MDPALLLDTLSPDDMEMWQCGGYNFFADDNNLNPHTSNGSASFKDSIKEENIEMDYCLSSICPNDLLSNMDQHLLSSTNTNPNTNIAYINNNVVASNANFGNTNYMHTNTANLMDRYEAYSASFSSNSSSSSSSSSYTSSSSSPNLDDMKSSSSLIQQQQHFGHVTDELQLNQLPPNHNHHHHIQNHIEENHMELKLEDTLSSGGGSPADFDQQFFQLDQTDSAHTSAASSPTSSTVSSSSASSLNDFNIYPTSKPGVYQIQPISQPQQQQQQQQQQHAVAMATNAVAMATVVTTKAAKTGLGKCLRKLKLC